MQRCRCAARLFAGGLLGFGFPILIESIVLEYVVLVLWAPWILLMGIGIGCILGLLRYIPPLKVWISLGTFTLVILSTILISYTKSYFLEKQRTAIALATLPHYPDALEVSHKYFYRRDVIPTPVVTMNVLSQDSFEDIRTYYKQQLEKEGWIGTLEWMSEIDEWKKGNYGIKIKYVGVDEQGKTEYWVRMEFRDFWLQDILKKTPTPSAEKRNDMDAGGGE